MARRDRQGAMSDTRKGHSSRVAVNQETGMTKDIRNDLSDSCLLQSCQHRPATRPNSSSYLILRKPHEVRTALWE